MWLDCVCPSILEVILAMQISSSIYQLSHNKSVRIADIDVRQERQHSELIHGLETFKTDQLKHADTKEKIVLPNAKGIAS